MQTTNTFIKHTTLFLEATRNFTSGRSTLEMFYTAKTLFRVVNDRFRTICMKRSKLYDGLCKIKNKAVF